MKNKKFSVLFTLIFGFIVVYMVVNILAPTKVFSENENKVLAKFPQLTFASLADGRFAKGYENYISDQFLLRDEWIGMKSVCEFVLLKTENNDVAYGSNGYLFPKFFSFDDTQTRRNLDSVRTFSAGAASDVSLIVVPSSAYVLSDYVPMGLPKVDEGFYIGEINAYLADSCNIINVKDALSMHANDYIYYRTDHHWTSYGAYLAYQLFAESVGLAPIKYESLSPIVVENFLGTSYSKAKNFNVVPDYITYFDVDATLTKDGVTHDGIYNIEQFEKRDKYAAFLYGNSGYTVVETETAEGKRDSILIIKDSYADSLVPYLTEHYEKIVLVDLRYYRENMAELRNQGFSDILFVYGFSTICNDVNVPMLSLYE